MVVAGHGLGKDCREHSAFDTAQREGAVLHPAAEVLPRTKEPSRRGAPAGTGAAPADPAPGQQGEMHLHLNTLCSSTETSDRDIKCYQLLLSGFISRWVMKAGDERL